MAFILISLHLEASTFCIYVSFIVYTRVYIRNRFKTFNLCFNESIVTPLNLSTSLFKIDPILLYSKFIALGFINKLSTTGVSELVSIVTRSLGNDLALVQLKESKFACQRYIYILNGFLHLFHKIKNL